MKLHIAGWSRFQHYRERRPPWIKLHVEILDEYDADGARKKFRDLPDSAKLTFLVLLPLASRYNGGVIPSDDPAWIAAQTGIALASVSLAPLIACGYLERDASEALAPCVQHAPKVLGSETETERETDTHTHRAREGWLGMVDRIRYARPEYGKLREVDVLNALRPAFGKPTELGEAVDGWIADHANALKPYDSPLSSLRKMVARVMEGSIAGQTTPARMTAYEAERQDARRRART